MKWRKTSYMILENNQRTEEKVQAAVDMIRALADEADNEMMLKIARCNFKTMARALLGHLV
jgi:hypothetical protein